MGQGGGSSWKSKLIIPVLTAGVGGGAYLGNRDPKFPVIGPAVTWVKTRLTTDFTKEGSYDVRLAKLTLEPAEFKAGDKLKLRVVVLKRGTDILGSNDTELWNSERLGETVREVGKDPLTASWTTQPFTLAWKKGERYVVEIWDTSPVIAKKLYSLEPDPAGPEFPFRGSKKLKRDGKEVESRIDFVTAKTPTGS